jgi:hypothetical protein
MSPSQVAVGKNKKRGGAIFLRVKKSRKRKNVQF